MYKTYVIAGLAITILIGGGFYFLAGPGDEMVDKAITEKTMMKDDTMAKKDAMVDKTPESAMMSAGSYEAFAPEKIATAAAKGKVVLFFHASWCPTCRGIDADIKAHLGDIPKDVSILDVDYDDSTALKQKYGVTHQHTFVEVDATGAEIAKWQGSPTLAALLANIK